MSTPAQEETWRGHLVELACRCVEALPDRAFGPLLSEILALPGLHRSLSQPSLVRLAAAFLSVSPLGSLPPLPASPRSGALLENLLHLEPLLSSAALPLFFSLLAHVFSLFLLWFYFRPHTRQIVPPLLPLASLRVEEPMQTEDAEGEDEEEGTVPIAVPVGQVLLPEPLRTFAETRLAIRLEELLPLQHLQPSPECVNCSFSLSLSAFQSRRFHSSSARETDQLAGWRWSCRCCPSFCPRW